MDNSLSPIHNLFWFARCFTDNALILLEQKPVHQTAKRSTHRIVYGM